MLKERGDSKKKIEKSKWEYIFKKFEEKKE